MMNFLKKLFGLKTVDFKEVVSRGGQIIDVRTPEEYKSGHIFNSKNIPLQQLRNDIKGLDLKKPIITCCASGMRSASAANILSDKGFEVYNGGGWQSLEKKLK